MPIKSIIPTRVARTCEMCQVGFFVKPSDLKRRCCSRTCYAAWDHQPHIVAARFWKYVDQTSDPDGCWLWTGGLRRGYGRFSLRLGQPVPAHRYAYEQINGVIPDGMFVLHRCDVRGCVRPSHLYAGTHEENMNDRADRGRTASGIRHGIHIHPERVPRGESHHATKMTRAQVDQMRLRYAAGGITQSALAREYGVTQPTVGNIILHKTWK